MIRAGSGSVIQCKDPRIQIRINMSRIRKTGLKDLFPNCTGPAEQLQPRAAALPCCQADRAGPAQDPPQQQTLRVTAFLRSVFAF
jgi:hypothetical protein